MKQQNIILKKVKVHNLQSIDLELKPNELIVFTGVSGSGKSSLAFDTLYVEGQRRYIESLSTQMRRQLGEMPKPDIESASGLSPTISIEQKTAGKNPRSTVGTMTEVYDYLRVLYARVGIAHCPVSGERVTPQSRERIIKEVQNLPEKSKFMVLAPYARDKKGEFKEDFQDLLRKGFMRARVDGNFVNLNDPIELDKTASHNVDVVIDRLVSSPDNHSRVAESITAALTLGNGACLIYEPEREEETLYSMHAFSPKSGLSYSALAPHDFSFNSPSGMCPRCHGLGTIHEFNLEKIIDPELSIAEDCCSIASSYQTVRWGNIYDNLGRLYNFSVKTPWKNLSKKSQNIFLYGTEKKWTRMRFVHPVTGAEWVDNVRFKGVLAEAHSRFAEAKSESYRKRMNQLMHEQVCPECHGGRLKPYPAATLINDKRIAEITQLTIAEALRFFEQLKLTEQEEQIADELLKEIRMRLRFLIEVGLHYLTLDRTSPTLSGGEAQRVRLASQIGCGLVGITYVLDEPSIGLHPRDNNKLIHTLKHLRDMGNTVVVVEHDEETIWSADRIVDFGPGPGSRGGRILVNGTLPELLKNKESITAAYLSGRKSIEVPKKRRKKGTEQLKITGASHHNLKNITVEFPLGIFIAVTGVSGSGKSSLITDTLYPALANEIHRADHTVGAHKSIKGIDAIDKVIAIDQSPIGRNPRSNPSTYIKLFDEIRDLFAELPESRARGYQPGRFSFNVREGSCPQCSGMGQICIDMDFMEDAWIECPLCQGKRFDPETLSVYYKGKNIYDVLEMEVAEALHHFGPIPSIRHKLETLQKVGLEYIKLGQSSTTLSGGEAQRVKLAKELVRPATGKTLYILDEPTTGLHFHDISYLLKILNELVEQGNTVLVIEHNMDVIKTADWIIDLGPEGGYAGGEVIAASPPEKIVLMDTPTGRALKEVMHHDIEARLKLVHAKDSGPRYSVSPIRSITVEGAEQNNLKLIDAEIPRNKITICTGPSGSGKSSLAFDTIYAEGQRRYIESLSPYARQFVKQMPKPKVAQVEGLSPAIAIEQKAHAGNPRSTVGTLTEIYDYLRILYARVGIPHCPETGEVIKAISKDHVVERILEYPEGEKVQILAPVELKKQENFPDIVNRLRRQGFVRIRLNGEFYDLDQEIPFDRKRKNELFLVIDRLKVNPSIKHRLFEAIENGAKIGEGKLTVMRESEDVLFNLAFAVESTGKSYPEITPHTFAFNTATGMCPECTGLGFQYGANLTNNREVMEETALSLMRLLWPELVSDKGFDLFITFLEEERIDPFSPLENISGKQIQLLMNGSEKWIRTKEGFEFRWTGINHVLAKAGKSAHSNIREAIIPLLDETLCLSCQGSRLNPLARNVTINDVSISALCQMPLEKAFPFIDQIPLPPHEEYLLSEVKKQLMNRLRFLCNVGLTYISLDRRAPTLSGGEAQRIRLARQLGSGLTGVLYVLDEPTIGLHPRDNARLNDALQQLKSLGNTLLMVEHDPLTIATADYLLDFGPTGGDQGGHIVARGTLKQIEKNKNSLTGAYLSGRKSIPIPSERRSLDEGEITIENATEHNLKNISVSIPIGAFTCITGVSGSGKSTLMLKVLHPAVQQGINKKDQVEINGAVVKGIDAFDRFISIDQNPIGHTIRSNVGTYADVLPKIRDFYASLPQARMRGLQPKHFSYNHVRGMCTSCWGMGYKKVEMHFLPPVTIKCEECQGLRLNPVSLEVVYSGYNFGQLFDLTITEARNHFQNHPSIVRILDRLISVGLGYLKLGQETVTLSGGEAQRIKLSRELAKRSTGRTLYLMDEPTTGLHSEDVLILLKVLHQLVDKGNTLVMIEHNQEMIKNADYIIDLGPDAGEHGGEVVCTGRPEEIAKNPSSYTGQFLSF